MESFGSEGEPERGAMEPFVDDQGQEIVQNDTEEGFHKFWESEVESIKNHFADTIEDDEIEEIAPLFVSDEMFDKLAYLQFPQSEEKPPKFTEARYRMHINRLELDMELDREAFWYNSENLRQMDHYPDILTYTSYDMRPSTNMGVLLKQKKNEENTFHFVPLRRLLQMRPKRQHLKDIIIVDERKNGDPSQYQKAEELKKTAKVYTGPYQLYDDNKRNSVFEDMMGRDAGPRGAKCEDVDSLFPSSQNQFKPVLEQYRERTKFKLNSIRALPLEHAVPLALTNMKEVSVFRLFDHCNTKRVSKHIILDMLTALSHVLFTQAIVKTSLLVDTQRMFPGKMAYARDVLLYCRLKGSHLLDAEHKRKFANEMDRVMELNAVEREELSERMSSHPKYCSISFDTFCDVIAELNLPKTVIFSEFFKNRRRIIPKLISKDLESVEMLANITGEKNQFRYLFELNQPFYEEVEAKMLRFGWDPDSILQATITPITSKKLKQYWTELDEKSKKNKK
ncbi:hypothetical protein PCE1_000225 [Barthelona sp. PCE]